MCLHHASIIPCEHAPSQLAYPQWMDFMEWSAKWACEGDEQGTVREQPIPLVNVDAEF